MTIKFSKGNITQPSSPFTLEYRVGEDNIGKLMPVTYPSITLADQCRGQLEPLVYGVISRTSLRTEILVTFDTNEPLSDSARLGK